MRGDNFAQSAVVFSTANCRVVQLTQPTTAVVPFYDPYFGYFVGYYGSTLATVSEVLKSFDQNEIGVDAAGGITYRLTRNFKLFTEALWNWVNTSPQTTQYIPVSIGIKW